MNFKRKYIPPVRRTPGTMNKTESKYAGLLETMKRAGEIIDYRFEPLKFRLAKDTSYCPDFMVIFEDRIEMHEVKGFWRDDARIKIKVAAEMYPFYLWKAMQLERGQWKVEEF